MPEQWVHLFQENIETLLPALAGLIVILVFLALALTWNYWRLSRGLKDYNLILARFGDRDIQAELGKVLTQVTQLEQRQTLEEERGVKRDQSLADLKEHLRRVIQRVGLLRFNAFPDVAGDQSYSLALLDQNGDGVVLTTLHGRAEARSYAKRITRGASTYPLIPEEQAAIFQALQGGRPPAAQSQRQPLEQGVKRSRPFGEAETPRGFSMPRRSQGPPGAIHEVPLDSDSDSDPAEEGSSSEDSENESEFVQQSSQKSPIA